MNGQKRDHEGCNCDETQGDFHPCPYDVEINDADPNEDSCDCCAYCEGECAMDI